MTEFERYLRHARLYGTDNVYEAATRDLPQGEVARLRIELDRIESHAARSRFARKTPKRRRSSEETLTAAVALRGQGLVAGAIADKLGITSKVVKELLARHRRQQRALTAPRPERAAGCRRCAWWQEGFETLDAVNEAVAAHRCPTGRMQTVSDADSDPPKTAWLSGEFTSETPTATDSLQEPFQQQSILSQARGDAPERSASASAQSLSSLPAIQARRGKKRQP